MESEFEEDSQKSADRMIRIKKAWKSLAKTPGRKMRTLEVF